MGSLQIMGKILLLDTETCGLTNHPIHGHPQIIELGYFNLESYSLKELLSLDLNSLPYYLERFKPSMEIHEQASKVNGIYLEDLLDCRESEEIDVGEVDFIIGHNSAFDARCLNRKDVKLICTKELAQLTFKGQRNNKLTTLIEFLYPEEAPELLKTAHSALQDCKLSFLILLKVLEHFPNITEWEQLAKLCSQGKKTYEEMDKPLKEITKKPFDKHKVEHLDLIPTSYFEWLNENVDLTPDLRTAIKKRLV